MAPYCHVHVCGIVHIVHSDHVVYCTYTQHKAHCQLYHNIHLQILESRVKSIGTRVDGYSRPDDVTPRFMMVVERDSLERLTADVVQLGEEKVRT